MPAESHPIDLTNHFLIAMPGMRDETFARSVVYLCEHTERGALGLMINKPSDLSLESLFSKVDLPLGSYCRIGPWVGRGRRSGESGKGALMFRVRSRCTPRCHV